MSGPLVSVIIPNYNYANSLGPCIDAALAQTHRPLEVIVVDDHSTDRSYEIASAKKGITLLRTPRNSGVAVARNTGVAASSGEILFFVDSDVALEPHAVEIALAKLAENPEYGAVCGIYEDTPLINDSIVEECRILQAYCWRQQSLGEVSFLFSSLTAIPRRVFDDIGPFNPRLRQTEEIDYGQRMAGRYKLLVTDEIRGKHDDDHDLFALMHKLYRRARLRVPLFAQRKKFAKGFETGGRSTAALAALLSLLPLPLIALHPAFAVLSVLLFAGSLAGDPAMYAYVLRHRGLGFWLVFVAVIFATNVAIAAGAAVGAVQWILSPRFRRLYDSELREAALQVEGQPA